MNSSSMVEPAKRQTIWQKILNYFLTKMIVAIAVILALVAFVEWVRTFFLDRTNFPNGVKDLVAAVTEASIVTAAYIFVFRAYEKRHIHELSRKKFLSDATAGFLSGILLQSLFILIIYLGATFLIVRVNSASSVLSPLAFGLSAGFVAEIMIIGIVFRLLEEQTGTVIALVVFIVLFALLHVNAKNANFVSVGATAMQAGFMLPASYVFRRSLWLPVFLHCGWDFAEPGIFGAINPSTSLSQGLLTSKIAGNSLLTGDANGPQDSVSSLLICFLLGLIFLLLAKRTDNIKKPAWRTMATRNP